MLVSTYGPTLMQSRVRRLGSGVGNGVRGRAVARSAITETGMLVVACAVVLSGVTSRAVAAAAAADGQTRPATSPQTQPSPRARAAAQTRSSHEAQPIIELGPATFKSVIAKGRTQQPIRVERLY